MSDLPEVVAIHTIQTRTADGAMFEIEPGTVFRPSNKAQADHLFAAGAVKVYVPVEATIARVEVPAEAPVAPKGKAKVGSDLA